MFNHRVGFTLALLAAVLGLAGCAGFMDSITSGLSSTTDYFKASAAEEQGDAAYERQDYPAALAAYQKAAEAGGRYGQFMLASMYLAGQGTKRDLRMYLNWMRQSAERGYAPANYLMGMAYMASDSEAARQYFEKAASQEHGAAMHMLGLLHAGGTGVPQSDQEALRWFRRARASGYPVDPRMLTASGIQAYAQEVRQRQAASSVRSAPASSSQKDLVREIQQRLVELGFDPGPVDGLLGQKTRAAITAFQRRQGLAADGRATPQVLDALKSATR